MLTKLRKKMAQSTLEYAVLAVVVIGALLTIQNYLKRGIQGKIKSSTDDISAEQYDTEATVYSKNTSTNSFTREESNSDGSRTSMTKPEKTVVNADSTTNTEND